MVSCDPSGRNPFGAPLGRSTRSLTRRWATSAQTDVSMNVNQTRERLPRTAARGHRARTRGAIKGRSKRPDVTAVHVGFGEPERSRSVARLARARRSVHAVTFAVGRCGSAIVRVDSVVWTLGRGASQRSNYCWTRVGRHPRGEPCRLEVPSPGSTWVTGASNAWGASGRMAKRCATTAQGQASLATGTAAMTTVRGALSSSSFRPSGPGSSAAQKVRAVVNSS